MYANGLGLHERIGAILLHFHVEYLHVRVFHAPVLVHHLHYKLLCHGDGAVYLTHYDIALGVYGLSSDTHIDVLYARLQLPFQALHDAGDTLHGLVYVIDHAVSNALFGIFADHGKHGYATIRLLLSCDTLDSC